MEFIDGFSENKYLEDRLEIIIQKLANIGYFPNGSTFAFLREYRKYFLRQKAEEKNDVELLQELKKLDCNLSRIETQLLLNCCTSLPIDETKTEEAYNAVYGETPKAIVGDLTPECKMRCALVGYLSGKLK